MLWPFRTQPHPRTEMAIGQLFRPINERPWGLDDEDDLSDGREVAAEMHGAFQHENFLRRGFAADVPEHGLVGSLHAMRRDDDAHSTGLEVGHAAEIGTHVLVKRAGTDEATV